MKKIKITSGMVEEWLGSMAKKEELYSIIAEIANGEYKPSQVKSDIINTLDLQD